MRKLSASNLRRPVLGLLASACLGTAAIGAMHTHSGRLMLARLGVPCPVNQVDPQRVLAVREDALARSRGAAPAPSRPALSLHLDTTTESEVKDWTVRTHVACDAISRGYHYLRCRGVPAAALGVQGPPVSEIWFSFGPRNVLVAINLYRRGMTEAQTQESWQTAVQGLHQRLGAPTQSSGDLTLAGVLTSPVAVARVQYQYADYLATVTASHIPEGGLAVREQYMSATATPAQTSRPG